MPKWPNLIASSHQTFKGKCDDCSTFEVFYAGFCKTKKISKIDYTDAFEGATEERERKRTYRSRKRTKNRIFSRKLTFLKKN